MSAHRSFMMDILVCSLRNRCQDVGDSNLSEYSRVRSAYSQVLDIFLDPGVCRKGEKHVREHGTES